MQNYNIPKHHAIPIIGYFMYIKLLSSLGDLEFQIVFLHLVFRVFSNILITSNLLVFLDI